MKYLPLIWSGLWRKRVRTILTLISVTVAFTLYGIADGVTAAFDHAIDRLTDATALRTMSRINITAGLPFAYRARIESVPGVREVGVVNFFGGYWQDPRHGINSAAIDASHLHAMGDFIVADEQLEAMKRTRTGAIIGPKLANEYGWKIGDRVTLKSRVWTRKDGSNAWPFDIVGIYSIPKGRFPDDANFWINYDYFDEARALGNGTVTLYVIKVNDAARAAEISAAIDRLFANSTDETLTQTEAANIHAQIDRVGNIGFIVGAIVTAVLFALLFVTGNTMMQSIRERIPELAVLKTYGFGNAAVAGLVVAESALLCVSAALLGLAIAAAAFPTAFESMGVAPLPLERSTIASGVGFALVLALASALAPLWRVQTMNLVDALAGR
jgi:putative ABC transport system permease protein